MNKLFLALLVPLAFAAGCSKTTEIDPTTPVAITPRPQAPVAVNTTPSTAPTPEDNSASTTSNTAPQGTELNTQPQSPSAATDAETSQKN